MAAGVTQIYDETLWTKQLWHRWKLDASQLLGSPIEEAPSLLSTYSDIQGAVHSSLDGPFPRQPSNAVGGHGLADAEALNDNSLLASAAKAVRCAVCRRLVASVWRRMAVELLRGQLSTAEAPALIPNYLADACRSQVGRLLRRQVILRLTVETDTQEMTFFVLRPRKAGTQPTPSEHAAVQQACQDVVATGQHELVLLFTRHLKSFRNDVNTLLAQTGLPALPDRTNSGDAAPRVQADSGDGRQAGGGGPPLGGDGGKLPEGEDARAAAAAVATGRPADEQVDAMVDNLLKGLAALLRREGLTLGLDGVLGAQTGGSPAGRDADGEDDDYLDDEDADGGAGTATDEEDEEAACTDYHPMCETWANEGECDANPKYMVGTSRLRGHCRKACGVCTPAANTPAGVLAAHPALAKSVRLVSLSMLQSIKAQGCGATQSCLSTATDVPATSGNVRLRQGIAQTTRPPGGAFVLGRPSWAVPEVKETPASLALAEAQRQGAGQPDSAGGTLQAQVDAALSPVLGGRLLLLHDEYFTYEYLYKNHTRHYHDEPRFSGAITEHWLLGNFQRQSVAAEAIGGSGAAGLVLEPQDLLPDLAEPELATGAWPYVKQVYANGQACTLGGGREAVRRTEVRLACSPDTDLHFLVREPDFCHYVFVIYVPALCRVPGFLPKAASRNS